MSARYVDCPRCEGTGIRVLRAHTDPNGEKITSAEIRCILCNGTGKASLLEPMRADAVKEVKTDGA